MRKRNAKDDLKICNAATRGPWKVEKLYHEDPGFEQYIKSAAVVDEDSTIVANNWSNPLEANLDFIALSRQALPYWIKRAREAERLLWLICPTGNFLEAVSKARGFLGYKEKANR